jgi:hypothetical protein
MELDELLRLDHELRRSTSRRLLVADAVFIACASLAYWIAASFASREVFNWVCAVCFMTAFVQIVVLICVVSHLLGYPVDYSFELGPTPAGRIFIRRLKERPPVSDEEFVRRFGSRYSFSGDQIRTIRMVLRSMDSMCDRVEPQEVVAALLYDLDFEDLYFVIAREFAVSRIPPGQAGLTDGTLDMVFMDVQSALVAG